MDVTSASDNSLVFGILFGFGWSFLLIVLLTRRKSLVGGNIRLQHDNLTKRERKFEEPVCDSNDSNPNSDIIQSIMERKLQFLLRFEHGSYGYATDRSDPRHIDNWRETEFPSLVHPIKVHPQDNTSTKSVANLPVELEVYLDFAGASLPTRTQLKYIYLSSIQPENQIVGNPHSFGPAAARTSMQIEQMRKMVLDFYGANEGQRYGYYNFGDGHYLSASTRSSNKNNSNNNLNSTNYSTDPEVHPGYYVVFTSGTTESLRLIAERFPWTPADSSEQTSDLETDKSGSVLLYPHNAHTSVVGMRNCALSMGTSFRCVHSSQMSETIDTITSEQNKNKNTQMIHNLMVLPLECNFEGHRYYHQVQSLIHQVRKISAAQDSCKWLSVLDMSKAAATSPINLIDLDPDFACLSFYKVFGDPTGVGVLFVKKTAAHILAKSYSWEESSFHSSISRTVRPYFGGGSVDAVMASHDFAKPRSKDSYLASLIHGTPNYRGILALKHGFDAILKLGGMKKISIHTTCLAIELSNRLRGLRHNNGQPLVQFYGAWRNNIFGHKIGRTTEDEICAVSSERGPTITFNLLRSDGSFVGYNEVQKLAELSRTPIQLRTGCFCNPGACQDALGQSHDDVMRLAVESKKICGDHQDIIDGKPTGAVRVSFGPYSAWEDLDVFTLFLEKVFLNNSVSLTNDYRTNKQAMEKYHSNGICRSVLLSEIYIFPIKSCAAMRVTKWQINKLNGMLMFDREFALVDSSGSVLRLHVYPKMSLISPFIDMKTNILTVRAPNVSELKIDLAVQMEQLPSDSVLVSRNIKVCGSTCGGMRWGDFDTSRWFSSFLGVTCWLVRIHNEDYERSSSRSEQIISSRRNVAYANEASLLLISQESVDILNKVIATQGSSPTVSSRHFRSNLVVRSPQAEEIESYLNPEDSWKTLFIPRCNLTLAIVGKCSRCQMVDVDPSSGVRGSTIKALAKYRRTGGNIVFGVFLSVTGMPDENEIFIEENESMVISW